jgi:hypothetical protein
MTSNPSSLSQPARPAFPIIEISFAPVWWHHYYGMDFDRAFWQDPVARTERSREQRRLLFDRFGDVGMGERDPQPQPVAGDAYGHRFMSAFWGCEIEYLPDQFPSAIVLPNPAERMPGLQVPSLADSPVIQRLHWEVRLLQERYGRCQAAVNYGGPLNNGVSVLGEEILFACLAEPGLARSVLQKMGEAVMTIHDQAVCPLNGITVSTAHDGEFGIGDCPVGMISPKTYQEVVLESDLWIRRQFRGNFNLHHCGIFDAYAGVYQLLNPGSLDLGPGSDLRLARKAYPSTPISTYIDVSQLSGMGQAEIDTLLAQMVENARPVELFTYIRVAEAGPEISDQAVRWLMTAPERIGA